MSSFLWRRRLWPCSAPSTTPRFLSTFTTLAWFYRIDVKEGVVDVQMTLTAPNCPAADFIVEDVRQKLESIAEVKAVNIDLVFDPAWDQSMMSDEAKLELGFM
jgi:metal-sulfur cluster biosynthetic enzyme